MKYKVALIQSEEGFSVSVPALPGCHSQGATEAEAMVNIEDAIREYIEAAVQQLREDQPEGVKFREIEVAV